jgi:4-hydroxy-tetrahydrodipicolinate synthase
LEFEGCFTASVTPFKQTGEIDWQAFEKITEFQCKSGVSGILFVGTTGESPTLNPEEHVLVIKQASDFVDKRILVIGGTGSNNTAETLELTESVQNWINAALLVDPYYNKPASSQIRKLYYMPIAEKFPELPIIPYVIPGRTAGTGLVPEDLQKLKEQCPNVIAVKDATCDIERTKTTRRLLPKPFRIFSGDDSATSLMMIDPKILGNGVISVISNVLPYSVQKLTELIKDGKIEREQELEYILKPLFDNVVTVKTKERAWPNPCGIKTLMAGLGMIDVSMRPPVGPMDADAVEQVRNAILEIIIRYPTWSYCGSHEIENIVQKDIDLIEEIFEVDVIERIKNDNLWKELSFDYK